MANISKCTMMYTGILNWANGDYDKETPSESTMYVVSPSKHGFTQCFQKAHVSLLCHLQINTNISCIFHCIIIVMINVYKVWYLTTLDFQYKFHDLIIIAPIFGPNLVRIHLMFSELNGCCMKRCKDWESVNKVMYYTTNRYCPIRLLLCNS